MKLRARAVLLALSALGCDEAARPRAELTVFVDTDVPLTTQAADPLAVMTTVRIDRLLIEVFDGDGRTLREARDVQVADVLAWPVSFGIRSAPDDQARHVRIRLRAYAGRPGMPRPQFTVDRVVLAEIVAGHHTRIDVDLHGDCMGVPADVELGSSCTEAGTDPIAVFVGETVGVEWDGDVGASRSPTRAGTWETARGRPCDGPPSTPTDGLFDEQVCIRGGVFHLGDERVFGVACPDGVPCAAIPERLVALGPFFVDRYPVTVGRYRAALLDETAPFLPAANELPIPRGSPRARDGSQWCTWTGVNQAEDADPLDDHRPLNCISLEGATAFCRWAGGELLDEAQYELLATAHGRPYKTIFPWGDELPSCSGVAFGRAESSDAGAQECLTADVAPGVPPLEALDLDARVRDVTPLDADGSGGIVALAAPLSHMLRDAAGGYDDPCWRSAPRLDPECRGSSSDLHVLRGGNFRSYRDRLRSAERFAWRPHPAGAIEVGFRCARPGSERP